MTKRLIITLPEVLERTIKKASNHRKCSMAEIVRTATYEHLKSFLEEDNLEESQ